MGQSNIAAGATIGSNHNSRGADGEIIMGRGFWPGLCVSLKHNSKFASFSILSKGDYPAELNVPIPFSLISHDVPHDRITIMPAFWFQYNMYALARNAWKYIDRDKRTERIQLLEFDYLAPDTINEIFNSLALIESATGSAYSKSIGAGKKTIEDNNAGKQLLKSGNKIIQKLEITLEQVENSKRKVVLLKVQQAYRIFEDLVIYYGMQAILSLIKENNPTSFEAMVALFPATTKRIEWLNIGGQLIPADEITLLKEKIKSGKIKSWDQVHEYYTA